MEFKFCWEYKNCEKACPVKETDSIFCWRVARVEGFQHPQICEACDYRRKWFAHEFSLQEFIRHYDRRRNRRSAKRILVVDDEPSILYALEETVQAEGYNCLAACDGEEGLFLAREVLPDLIITDVIMPKVSGYDLCHTIKNESLTSHIPVIIVTVRGQEADRRKGKAVGADAYLLKPFKASELCEKIGMLLGPPYED